MSPPFEMERAVSKEEVGTDPPANRPDIQTQSELQPDHNISKWSGKQESREHSDQQNQAVLTVGDDLGSEFRALPPLPDGALSFKLPVLLTVRQGHIIDDGETFQFHEAGRKAAVIAVRREWLDPEAIDCPRPAVAVRSGALIDLVAIPLPMPKRGLPKWFLRRNAATWLGLALYEDPNPTPLFRSPVGWLQNGAVGICPLSADAWVNQDILLRLPKVTVEDELHYRSLLDFAQAPPRNIPEFYIRKTAAQGIAA